MLKRIKASLANPSSIPLFRKDNIFLVLLYLVVLSFITTLPGLISSVRQKGVGSTTKYEIRTVLVENRESLMKGEIIDNTITLTNKVDGFIIGDRVGFILPYEEVEPALYLQQSVYYVCKINDHDITIYFLGNKIKSYTYDKLDLNGITFDFLYEDDYNTRNAVFEQIEKAYDMVVKDLKPYWITFNCLSAFFKVFVIAIIFDLILALLVKGFRGLSFKEALVIAMYSFVMEIVGQIIDALYGFTIFSYIGAGIGIIFFFIAMRSSQIFKIDDR